MPASHTFVSALADDPAHPEDVRPSNWNADHPITLTDGEHGTRGAALHTDAHAAVHAIDGANHTGVLTDGQIPASIARDTELPTAGTTPSQIDIGDAQTGGADATFSKNDHQHAFPAPAGGYPVDVAATEADGTATTSARADHRHAHGSGYSPDAHHAQAHNNDHATGGADAFAISDLLDAIARVTVRKNTGGADVGSRRRLNLIEGANITLTVADDAGSEEVDVTIAAAGASVAMSSVDIPFTDGDTLRRVTVTDAAVTAASKIIGAVRRPDSADDSADAGYLYVPNVVRVAAGAFDLLVACLDWGFGDPTENPPNETVKFVYAIG